MTYTTLDNFSLQKELISNSPSRKDGVDEETEKILRHYGCDLIQEAGVLLKLRQAAMATGQVLIHRFYCKKSFARFNVKKVATSCVWLAAKLEENPREATDALKVMCGLDRHRQGIAPPDAFSKSAGLGSALFIVEVVQGSHCCNQHPELRHLGHGVNWEEGAAAILLWPNSMELLPYIFV